MQGRKKHRQYNLEEPGADRGKNDGRQHDADRNRPRRKLLEVIRNERHRHDPRNTRRREGADQSAGDPAATLLAAVQPSHLFKRGDVRIEPLIQKRHERRRQDKHSQDDDKTELKSRAIYVQRIKDENENRRAGEQLYRVSCPSSGDSDTEPPRRSRDAGLAALAVSDSPRPRLRSRRSPPQSEAAAPDPADEIEHRPQHRHAQAAAG